MKKNILKTSLLIASAIPIALLGVTSNNASAYTTQDVLSSGAANRSFSISHTGRYVLFHSNLSTLVPNDTNNKEDLFIKDTETGQISLVSATPSNSSGNAPTTDRAVISGNGRYVLFSSPATNLSSTTGAYNAKNLYLRDTGTSTTTLIVIGSAYTANHYPIGLSEDGRFAYYETSSSSNGSSIQMFDRNSNTNERIDVDNSGAPGNQSASRGNMKSVSCDGRFSVFTSSASNLVENDNNNFSDVYLVDRMNGHYIKNLTLGSNASSISPHITCDGNYIFFITSASNLISSDTNGEYDLYKYSVTTGTTERVSVKNDGGEYTGSVTSLGDGAFGGDYSVTLDGRFVYFTHALGRNVGSGTEREFIMQRDTLLSTTTLVVSSGTNDVNKRPNVTYDGRKLFYYNFNAIKVVSDL